MQIRCMSCCKFLRKYPLRCCSLVLKSKIQLVVLLPIDSKYWHAPHTSLYNQQILHQSPHSFLLVYPRFLYHQDFGVPPDDSTYLYCHEANPCYSPVASLQAGHLNLPGGDPISNFSSLETTCQVASSEEKRATMLFALLSSACLHVPKSLVLHGYNLSHMPGPDQCLKHSPGERDRRCYTGCHIEYGPILEIHQQPAWSPSDLKLQSNLQNDKAITVIL
ncbi:hypothetical protein Pelo_16618 [Pelomyxa schiedti]|nr:hypothetical protein Pelo_16618 [Pelomyxa schiedti]